MVKKDANGRLLVPFCSEDDRRKLLAEAIHYKTACALVDDPNLVFSSQKTPYICL